MVEHNKTTGELPADVVGWTHSLESSERNYRILAGCRIPPDECPWSESDHAEARIIMCILSERDDHIATLTTALEELRVSLAKVDQVLFDPGHGWESERIKKARSLLYGIGDQLIAALDPEESPDA